MNFLLLVLCKHQVVALLHRGASVDMQPIHAESDWYPVKDAKALKGALKDLQSRLEKDSEGAMQVNLVYDLASKDLLQSWPWESDVHWRWQWLAWEALATRAGLKQAEAPPVTRVRENLLPVVRDILEGRNDDDAHPVTDPVTEEKTGDPHEQIAKLEQENRVLRSRLQDLPAVDPEQLVAYLPALYQHVYSELSGSDLALLAGRVEPFQIQSPYQEPSEDALHIKQRKFLSLPLDEQKKIVQLAQSASRKLKPRLTMLATIRGLEE